MSVRKRNLAISVGLLVLVGVALVLMLKIDRKMRADMAWAPPAIQVRLQAKQLVEERDSVSIPDDEIGFVLPGGLEQDVSTLDFRFIRKLDSKGFANENSWPNSAEIIFLGDSVSMAEGVGVSKGYTALIGDALADTTVINLSLPGAGLIRQARILNRFDDELAPKMIVSFLPISSSFLNDIQFNAWVKGTLDKSYSNFRGGYNRRRQLQEGGTLSRKLQKRAIYHWLLAKVEPMLSGKRNIVHSIVLDSGDRLQFDRAKVRFAQRNFTKDDPEIGQLGNSVDQLAELARRNSAKLLVVLLPGKEELFAHMKEDQSGNALDVVKHELELRNIEYIDAYPVLQRSATTKSPFFERDIHFNEHGNRLIADTFLQWYSQEKRR